MKIGVITIFPTIFDGFVSSSLIAKAVERELLSIDRINPRDFASPPHYNVDDTPYGGGPGMVMKPEPVVKAVTHLKERLPDAPVIFLSPSGATFTQERAEAYSKHESLILLCGRYEGLDQRAIDLVVDEEISIGDYVLMGGEVPAMAVIEAVVRLRPEVLGNSASAQQDSFSGDSRLLEAPQYTKPRVYADMPVPDVLLSGDHKKIGLWRREQSIAKTARVRPDLIRNK